MATRGGVGAISWHELYILTARPLWRVAAVALVGLLAASSWAAASRYRAELSEREHLRSLYREELEGLSVARAARYWFPALKPPWRLSFLVDGGQATALDAYRQQLDPREVPRLSRTFSRNDRLPRSPPLDWLLVLRLVLSLLAFGLCFDRVCRERETGTLKLLLSYPVPRWRVLAGKFVAAWSCLAGPLLLGAAGGFGWMSRGETWSREELVEIGGTLSLVLWALALFVGLALLVSALVRLAADSLNVLLLLWIALVLMAPAVAVFAAQRLRPVSQQIQVDWRLQQAQRQITREYRGTDSRWRAPEFAVGDSFAWEKRSAEATSRLFQRQEKIRRQVLTAKLEQAELARDLAAVSPMFLIQGLAERLAGTGVARDRSFLEQAWRFREVLAETLRRQDARDPASSHILFFVDYMSQRPLVPSAMPRFVFREATVRQGLAAALPWMLLLALETVALAAAALWAFERYDVGRSR
jgi:ABC-type transport system involved in multi-copper enzyme maturation permease subunit